MSIPIDMYRMNVHAYAIQLYLIPTGNFWKWGWRKKDGKNWKQGWKNFFGRNWK